ncbi:hypothetical protein [Aurantimonas sp. Leaf443]|uniref:hypothetical protein n=1 Tax=Aurantimonas sp. Leaf443 TaxID=1736378 RepID=UPI0006F96822|nr:hypothetical protein [Aurantimonas sp. Leaf443]KQT85901.1 hypothetical protein ASG48_04650 [Aurantimonas sp. Leaf443]
MIRRRSIIVGAFAAATLLAAPAALAQNFTWDGTWSGRSANGRTTAITIAKGKVVSWLSNGKPQQIASSSVAPTGVAIRHAEGAAVRLTARDARTATYSWKGNGASSTAILKR